MQIPKWRDRFSIRRGVYLLPSLFTLANMLFGFYAIILAYKHKYLESCTALVAAGIADMLDGKIARMTNTTSEFGVEFDSLSDLVSFCIAPALLLYFWWLETIPKIGWVCAFVFVACGAIRLARFNAYDSTSDTSYFNGLPTPAAAAGAISLVLLEESVFPGETHAGRIAPWACILLAFLMVSNIRYPSFKNMKLGRRVPARMLIAVVFLVFIFVSKPDVAITSFCFIYLLSGLVMHLMFLMGLKTPKATVPGEEESTR